MSAPATQGGRNQEVGRPRHYQRETPGRHRSNGDDPVSSRVIVLNDEGRNVIQRPM